MSPVVLRWKARLAVRRALLLAARKRHEAHPTDATRKLIEQRKQQVAYAERVIARNTYVTRVSQDGVDLIKSFEGFIGHIYDDGTGVKTIGYGTTRADVNPLPTSLTEPQAARLLEDKLDKKYAPAVANLKLPLNQHQFDALVSFIYNCGPGAIGPNTGIGRALRDRNFKAAADNLLEWDKAGGRRLPGLTRRRQAERALFLKADK